MIGGIDTLEKRCIEPGLWEVEGHQVRRIRPSRARGATSRWIDEGEQPPFQAWLVVEVGGGHVAVVRKFSDALGVLFDHLDNGECRTNQA